MSPRPMTEDDLNGFVDRTLDAVRHAEVAAYLSAHPDMARRIAGYGEQRDMLRAAFAPVAEEPIPTELDLSRMIAERNERRLRARRWAMAAAAVLLLCGGAAGGWVLRGMGLPPAGGIQALAREAAVSYAVYAPDQVRPVEIRADDREGLARWTARQIGQPIAIPDLAPAGYRFMGGRIVPTDHGPAAMFMYDDDKGTRLVMLARPMAAEREAAMALHSQGPLNGYSWADNGLGYSLVGAAPAGVLHPLADAIRRQIRGNV
jgi:anti-sigma factor RsiW